ncbi:hypothetical protein GOBAR_DD25211 [Gossypium barbadense]|nr:hypothetical protein GOBAR_DD25211 [Gossypium barbadense]
MVERGLLVLDSKRSFEEVENYCEFHHKEGHEIQECTEFRALVQDLMVNKEMEFYEEAKEEGSICTSESTKIVGMEGHEIQECTEFRALVQDLMVNKEMEFYEEAKEEGSICTSESTKKPATFSYQDSRKVPWNECNTTVPGMETTKDQDVSADPEHVKGRAIIVEQEGKIAKPVLSSNEPIEDRERKGVRKKTGKNRARLNGKETKWEPMIIPHVSQTFVSGGVIHAKRKIPVEESIKEKLGNMHINAIHEHVNEERSWLDIRPYEPGSVLDNYTAEEIPKVFRTVLE